MANRKKDDGTAAIVLVLGGVALVVAAILIASIYVMPILLAGALFYYGHRAGSVPASFALGESEANRLAEVEYNFGLVERRLREIEEDGADLRTNRDGSYHRGSRLGAQLNDELDELMPIRESLRNESSELRSMPSDALDLYLGIMAKKLAAQAALKFYAVAALAWFALEWVRPTAFASFVGQYAVLRLSTMNDAVYGSAAAAALAGALAFPIAARVFRKRLEQAMKETVSEVHLFAYSRPSIDNMSVDEDDVDGYAETGDAASAPNESESGPPWFEVLDVTPDASADEINAAWRDKIKRTHPDLVAGLDDEFRALAEKKAKQINSARSEGLSCLS